MYIINGLRPTNPKSIHSCILKRDKAGKFLPGNIGRPTGAISSKRLTSDVRRIFKDLLKSNLDTIKQDFESLPTKERLEIICLIAPYIDSSVEKSEQV